MTLLGYLVKTDQRRLSHKEKNKPQFSSVTF